MNQTNILILLCSLNRTLFLTYTCYAETGLPQSVKSVVKATAFDRGVVGPSMQSVIEVLTHHGIQVESKKMQVRP